MERLLLQSRLREPLRSVFMPKSSEDEMFPARWSCRTAFFQQPGRRSGDMLTWLARASFAPADRCLNEQEWWLWRCVGLRRFSLVTQGRHFPIWMRFVAARQAATVHL
jgi:hypothetical protein